ncbi:protein of unknown function DUF87 [Micromonospora phaseoli]|uniref:Helicase HerA central domain-containing protein n=1 Tax=Micromonospora phaseoli TaxID=1144548 RepID=A0A1H6VAW6_9ACTN|nr:DUF3710 domain-containing protein [Micromonospora phaseoli]PZV93633.1 uncharacterized protein DUF87 [Micromonospora phaseoli]GIJ79813.1 hypothetical protein Xph01_42450 [Micromonospora phaseoli]SEJ01698.1 protein of unknown function DUF87 [Micromonospora phaseoli]
MTTAPGNRPLRLCVVQLDGTPQALSEYGKLWLPAEPLASEPDFTQALSATAFFAAAAGANASNILRDVQEIASTETRQLLSEILAFVDSREADVVVLPEYVIPISCLDVLVGFSRGRALVAGMGIVRNRAEAEMLAIQAGGRLGAGDLIGRNLSVLVENERVHLVTKHYPSEHEVAEVGNGPIVVETVLRGRAVRIGVAVCLDYLRSGDELLAQKPDVVCVPAFTATVAPFVPDRPRDYVRLIANCARHGGSTIVAPSLRGSAFVDKRGVAPVGRGYAAILMVDHDRYAQQPTSLARTENRLVLRSEIIERRADSEVAVTVVRALDERRDGQSGSVTTDLPEQLTRWLTHLPTQGPLRQSLEEYRRALAQGLDDDRHYALLGTHLAVTSMVEEEAVRAKQAKLVVRRIGDLVASGVEVPPVGALLDAHRALADKFREEDEIRRVDGNVWSFAIRLGRYDSRRAVSTLPRQLNFLRALSALPPDSFSITYRLHSVSDPHSPDLRNYFDVIVTGDDSVVQADQVEGQLRSMLVACWSLSRSDESSGLPDGAYCLRITPDLSSHSPTVRDDWSPIFDLIRTHDTPIAMDMRVTPVAPLGDSTRAARTVDDDSVLLNTLTSMPYMTVGDEAERRAAAYFSLLRDMSKEESKGLGMSLVLSSEQPIPDLLADTIRHEVFGTIPATVEQVEPEVAHDEPVRFSPSELIRIFHPPYGQFQARGRQNQYDGLIHYQGPELPKMGLRLGSAKIAGPKVDRSIDVLLDETARVRHMYVVGKTGTGKTNFLKELCRQDLAGRRGADPAAKRGLVVIDPHGDLVDYLAWHCQDRLGETVLLDFGRSDYLPVLNPLLLDIHDERSEILHTTDFLRVLESRYYNEFTGPVFDDMVRQALETMFEPEFPVPRSLDLVEIMYRNREIRRLVAQSIESNTVLRDRWNVFESISESERAERVVWMLSKLADLMPSGSRVRASLCSTRNSPLSIDQIVWNNGVLLVKIPESTLGAGAASFIGSLLLRRIQRAVFDYERGTGRQVANRLPFTLYIDEFQKFATAGLEGLIAEARKFGCGLVLAHQNLEQLYAFSRFEGGRSRELLNAILGNVGTTVSFRVGPQDAEILSDVLRTTGRSFDELPKFKALCRLIVDHDDTPCFTLSVDDSRRQLGIKAAADRLNERMIEQGYWVSVDESGDVERHLERFEEALSSRRDQAKAAADRARADLREELMSTPGDGFDKLNEFGRTHPEFGTPVLVHMLSGVVSFHLDAPASVRQELVDALAALFSGQTEPSADSADAFVESLLRPLLPADVVDQAQATQLIAAVAQMIGVVDTDEEPVDAADIAAMSVEIFIAGFVGALMDTESRRSLASQLVAAGVTSAAARAIVADLPAAVASAVRAWQETQVAALELISLGAFLDVDPGTAEPQPDRAGSDGVDEERGAEEREAEERVAEEPEAEERVAEEPEAEEPVVSGPRDISEVDVLPANHLDLGAMFVTVADGVRFSVSAGPDGDFRVLVAEAAAERMNIELYAATGGPLWPEVRAVMAGRITQDGLTVRKVAGPFGDELHYATEDGQQLRAFGIDGPGWFLRIVQAGPAAWESGSVPELEAMVRGIVVKAALTNLTRHEKVMMRIQRDKLPVQGSAESNGDEPRTQEVAGEAK